MTIPAGAQWDGWSPGQPLEYLSPLSNIAAMAEARK